MDAAIAAIAQQIQQLANRMDGIANRIDGIEANAQQAAAAAAEAVAAAAAAQAAAAAAPPPQLPAPPAPQPAPEAPAAAPLVQVVLPRPEKFSGTKSHTELHNWVHQMESYLRVQRLLDRPEAIQQAVGYLTGAAQTWWRFREKRIEMGLATEITTWAEMREAIVEYFGGTNPQQAARDELEKCSQTKSVKEYAQRFQLLMLELPDMAEADRIYKFIRGLKGQVKLQVMMQHPESLTQAIELADAADSTLFQMRRNDMPRQPPPINKANRNHNGAVPMELGTIQQTTSASQSRNDDSQRRCYICQEPGHIAKNCPKKTQNRQRNDAPNWRQKGEPSN